MTETHADKLIKELRALGRGETAHSYFLHTSGRTHMREVDAFFQQAVSLSRQAADTLSAALSVPAEAVVGEPVGDIAYNAGLEIRYAIAASGVDPIQHIPEVDAIIERRLAEARKAAFIEAAEMATATGTDAENDWPGETWIAGQIAAALRAKAEEAQA